MLTAVTCTPIGRRLSRCVLQLRRLHAVAKTEQFHVGMLDGNNTGIAVFTMDRPDARNALGRQFMAEFRQALEQVRFDSTVRVVVVRSAVPRVFCAGADLKERLKMTPSEVTLVRGVGYPSGCILNQICVAYVLICRLLQVPVATAPGSRI